MSFSITFSEEALAQLRKLDNETVKRILDKIEDASANPAHFFGRLAGREEYKLRVGDYRIIAKVLFTENKIFILSLGHRKNIYKR